eukprot:scaffold7346_cov245-Pinguiococcus_pyrenoidosus.AAC.4
MHRGVAPDAFSSKARSETLCRPPSSRIFETSIGRRVDPGGGEKSSSLSDTRFRPSSAWPEAPICVDVCATGDESEALVGRSGGARGSAPTRPVKPTDDRGEPKTIAPSTGDLLRPSTEDGLLSRIGKAGGGGSSLPSVPS